MCAYIRDWHLEWPIENRDVKCAAGPSRSTGAPHGGRGWRAHAQRTRHAPPAVCRLPESQSASQPTASLAPRAARATTAQPLGHLRRLWRTAHGTVAACAVGPGGHGDPLAAPRASLAHRGPPRLLTAPSAPKARKAGPSAWPQPVHPVHCSAPSGQYQLSVQPRQPLRSLPEPPHRRSLGLPAGRGPRLA